MTLKVGVNAPPFFIPAESNPECMFDANLVIPAQICEELLHEQPKVSIILRQNGQVTLKVKVNDLHFQLSCWKIFHDTFLVLI